MRYLDLIEKHPDFYLKSKGKEEIAAFRSSLYQSCRNACFAHHRKHIRSQKRGLNLRHGMVHLDHSELNSEGIVVNEGLIASGGVEYSAIYKPIADSLYNSGNYSATRLWCLLWHENKPMSAILMAEFGEDKDRVIHDIRRKVVEFLPGDSNISHNNIMNATDKQRFKELAQRALKAGVIKVENDVEEDPVSRLLGVVAKMDDTQAEAILDIISGNNTAIPLKPTTAIRRETVVENAKKWLVIDYEIVSDALDIEINPEMNPLVVRRLLDSAIERFDHESRKNLPEIVWEFIRSINEVFPDTYQEGSKLEVREIRDSIMTVMPPIPAPSFISVIRDSRKWMSWVDANTIRFWQESDTILFESANLRDVDKGFMQTVLNSFSE
jgi:hypothetical protein